MHDLCELKPEELADIVVAQGGKAFQAKQLIDWVYHKGVVEWDKMTNLSKDLREKLSKQLRIPTLELIRVQPSDDGETFKFLWKMREGTMVESVLICSGIRRTVCVSSQVGCPVKCAFCASGKNGFVRNLRPADKFDNLVGCFSAGLKPTSSSDPYALRRQTLGIVRIALQNKLTLPLEKTIRQCLKAFPEKVRARENEIVAEILSYLTNRIKTVFLDEGFTKDEIEAAISFGVDDIYDAWCRVKALHEFRLKDGQFAPLYEVYKRAKGQIGTEKKGNYKDELLVEPAEQAMAQALHTLRPKFEDALAHKNYDEAYVLVAKLQPPLATLFNDVRILADDPAIQANRIALLQQIFGLFGQLIDFSKIQS